MDSDICWTTFDISGPDAQDGYTVTMRTNDDDDDGVPGATVHATYRVRSFAAAVRLTGKTRRGIWGHRVDVFLNGQSYP